MNWVKTAKNMMVITVISSIFTGQALKAGYYEGDYYYDNRGRDAGTVLAPTVTGAAIGGIAGGGRGAAIGAGVGAGVGLFGLAASRSNRPRRLSSRERRRLEQERQEAEQTAYEQGLADAQQNPESDLVFTAQPYYGSKSGPIRQTKPYYSNQSGPKKISPQYE